MDCVTELDRCVKGKNDCNRNVANILLMCMLLFYNKYNI